MTMGAYSASGVLIFSQVLYLIIAFILRASLRATGKWLPLFGPGYIFFILGIGQVFTKLFSCFFITTICF